MDIFGWFQQPHETVPTTIVWEFQRTLELALQSINCPLGLTLEDTKIIPNLLSHRKVIVTRTVQLVIVDYDMVLSTLRVISHY